MTVKNFRQKPCLGAWGWVFGLLLPGVGLAKPATIARIAFLESFAETETSLSDRYAYQYRGAVAYGLSRNEKKLNACGMGVEIFESSFNPADKLSATTAAEAAMRFKPWVVFGPRRSDHFLAVSKVIQNIPLVSYIANANEVFALKLPILTLAASSRAYADGAIQEIMDRKYGKRFGVAVDPSCASCKDFADIIADNLQKKKFTQAFRVSLTGDQPELSELLQKIREAQIDFLVVPNYASQSGHVIKTVFPLHPQIAYVGADNWGDGQVGYFNKMGFDTKVHGFCMRPSPGSERMEQLYEAWFMSRMILQKNEFVVERPGSSAYTVIHFLDRFTDLVCQLKKTSAGASAETFLAAFQKEKGQMFKPLHTIGVSEFYDGKLRDKKFIAR